MTHPILRFVHLLGLTLMGAGLIGVWYVWIALACLGANVLGAVCHRRAV